MFLCIERVHYCLAVPQLCILSARHDLQEHGARHYSTKYSQTASMTAAVPRNHIGHTHTHPRMNHLRRRTGLLFDIRTKPWHWTVSRRWSSTQTAKAYKAISTAVIAPHFADRLPSKSRRTFGRSQIAHRARLHSALAHRTWMFQRKFATNQKFHQLFGPLPSVFHSDASRARWHIGVEALKFSNPGFLWFAANQKFHLN
ncbi:uncharacterized protein MYCFIDRAFT_175874 [Pseudocercospora fijiensis CIRAD86]|uniref:Uncharacterized protein n=1 Tax=Pseudocercospora fijiensis (strain CIRAD86) TaxID=383855 RepID=M2YXA4_PSEFD|nr:uncharacterized protein MYCFIDRAFT_175874 [Pseudocercospora fijiensis CIRAD86]EME82335.1 hypothetical protein MYCFIDRAFT_175874 [Pseudocercospora fijiensis CIRAD86]